MNNDLARMISVTGLIDLAHDKDVLTSTVRVYYLATKKEVFATSQKEIPPKKIPKRNQIANVAEKSRVKLISREITVYHVAVAQARGVYLRFCEYLECLKWSSTEWRDSLAEY